MRHRANFVLDDKAWALLQAVPKGRRSQVVNQAIVAELTRRQRLEVISNIDRIRARMQPLGESAEQWTRDDRNQH